MQKTLFVLGVFVLAIFVGLLFSGRRLEGFMQQPVGAPIGGAGIGPYDNVYLPGVAAGWLATEDNFPTKSAPLTQTSPHPFLLDSNRTSTSCCTHSPVSSDMGCICLTPADEKLFESRGGNRAYA